MSDTIHVPGEPLGDGDIPQSGAKGVSQNGQAGGKGGISWEENKLEKVQEAADGRMKRRLVTFDYVRAIGIVCVLPLHRLHYDFVPAEFPSKIASSSQRVVFILVALILDFAPIFYYASGAVLTYRFLIRNSSRHVSKTVKPRTFALRFMLFGIIFLIAHYVYSLFLMNGFAEHHPICGLLTCALRYGIRQTVTRGESLAEPGTLSFFAMQYFTFALVFAALLRSGHARNPAAIKRVFVALAVVFFLSAPLVRAPLFPVFKEWVENGRYAPAAILGLFIGGQNFAGLVGFVGFSFAGGAVGATVFHIFQEAEDGGARERRRTDGMVRRLKRALAWGGLPLIVSPAAIIPVVMKARGTSTALRPDDEVARDVGRMCTRLCQCGLFMVATRLILFRQDIHPFRASVRAGAVALVDRAGEGGSGARRRGVLWRLLRPFATASLSVYFYEALMAAAVRALAVDPVCRAWGFEQWRDSAPAVVLFGVLQIVLWYLVLCAWSLVGFVGSLEWIYTRIGARFMPRGLGSLKLEAMGRAVAPRPAPEVVELAAAAGAAPVGV